MYNHLLGRLESNDARLYYKDFKNNDLKFDDMEIKLMSKITKNIMGAINYKSVKEKRMVNFKYLDKYLSKYNELTFNNNMTYMYPLLVKNGKKLKEKLIEKKIFVPTLWPNVLDDTTTENFENSIVKNIVLLPIDQRYNIDDMKYIINIILDIIGVD